MTENKLICPICNKQMKIGMLDPDDSMATVWMSIMPCDCVCSHGASKAVWQELITTRKALDVAVDALKLMYQGNGDPQDIMRYIDNRWTPVRRLCKQTLEQIQNITKGGK